MRIAGIESTDLFLGTRQRPLQVIKITVVNENPAVPHATVAVRGAGLSEPSSLLMRELKPGERRTLDMPVAVAVPYQAGSGRPVTVEVPGDRREAVITVAEPGWTMWMVSHFHYDPVWWNTQGQFTEARLVLPDEDGRLPDVRTAFELVRVHLDKARNDPDYKFVLAEIDYLKPYLDSHPEDRAELRRLLADGRVEIVGGNYNEPNTNLISAEAVIRNAVYGIGYQRDVAGGHPRTAWMLDVFGHDPGYPGLMAAAGLTESAWARGPFHQWGPAGADGGVARMQFSSEFEWLSPDGTGLLTHYMAHHYGAGWRLHTPSGLAEAEHEAYEQFRGLARVAATRNVLLPVGADHVIPARWVTDVHRSWNAKYVWPRFVTAVPAEFFAAVRAESGPGARAWISPQTRDMNPVYTGKDVSYVDTKQGQRAIEVAVTEAERLATLAALAGAPYPHAALDKAWRLLAYGAHHDGITGVASDQAYLDLAGGWREAWDLASAARANAARHLGGGTDVTVVNGLARRRDGLATVTVTAPAGTAWLELRDAAGSPVPALASGVLRHQDGSLASMTLTFLAADLPGLGWRGYSVVPVAASETTAEWTAMAGTVIANASYEVAADPERGGAVMITDRRAGQRVLTAPGNELIVQDEYAQHPKHGEGPWHLSPKGPVVGSAASPASVVAERCPAGARLVASFTLAGMSVVQETLLWDGVPRVDFRTHVDGFAGRDQLLRVRFPADVPGGLPVYQTATAVIGRSFGCVDVDSARHWYTLDNPAHGWFGLGAAARVTTSAGDLTGIGVAEVVCPDGGDQHRRLVRDLLIALAAAGVTATCSAPDGPRYGAIDADSNLPDVRIVLGGPDMNTFSAAVLSASALPHAESPHATSLAAQLAASGAGRVLVPAARPRAVAFRPGADVRGERDLPALIVAGTGPAELETAVRDLISDLADAVIEVPSADGPPGEALADRSVALFNRGTPGSVVTPDGTLHISLMRSCTAWPAGIWIDGERRATPDGSSFASQHWSHTFEYALAAGPGDWRAAGFNVLADDYAHEPVALHGKDLPHGGRPHGGFPPGGGPDGGGLLSVEPASVTLSALKPRGNPLASGLAPHDEPLLTIRLRETEGRATTAIVRMAAGISQAWQSGLIEDTLGDPLPVTADGAVPVRLPPFGTVTLAVRTPASAVPAMPDAAEPVQPVFTRYWLHGKGPAPAGNLPAAVHLSPTRIALGADAGEQTLRLTVAAGPQGATGQLALLVPDGLEVTPAGPLSYDVGGGGHAAWHLTVRAAGAAPGRYFVAARTRDAAGLETEDVAMVAVGEKRWPARDLPAEEAMERMLADYAAAAAEVDLAVRTPSVSLPPGGSGELAVAVTSHLASELRGEALVISPFGTWDLLCPAAQPLILAPGVTAEVRCRLTAPGTARPGSAWWAIVKLGYFGRVRYSEAIAITIT